ncbi:hypothetical protein CLOM_g23492 [Closterium sp. NIES-68]|nr:hypothetical protein CLOM_g23492 [Closterium sp. NIES-68]GJP81859.1 hypothetical protein CLOP_g11977 [Closterium sp. NIES-67]
MGAALESLPDELLLLILSKAAAAAASPVDLAKLALTSPRFARLVREPPVLSRLPLRAILPSARIWAPGTGAGRPGENETNAARECFGSWGGGEIALKKEPSGAGSEKSRMACRFLLQCGLAGCADALYALGMIKFYCHRDFWAGASLLVWAAEKGHVAAIYSLAIIHSHGSGGGSSDGNPAAATDILWHAARAGSKQALQELGHCYLDGHGVPQRTLLGARLLLAAMCPALAHSPHDSPVHAAAGELHRGRADHTATAQRSHMDRGMVVTSYRQRQQQQQQPEVAAAAASPPMVATGVVQEPSQARRWLLEECRSELRGGGMGSVGAAGAAGAVGVTRTEATPLSHLVANSPPPELPDSALGSGANVRSNAAAASVSLQPASLQGPSLSMQPLRGQQGPVISIVRCAAGCHTAISVLSHSSSSSPASTHTVAPCASSAAPGHITGLGSFAPSARSNHLASGSAQPASDVSNRWQVSDAPWHAAAPGYTDTMDGAQGWRTPAVSAAPSSSAAGADLDLEAAAAAAAAAAAEQHGLTSKIAELFAPSGENGGATEAEQGHAVFEDSVPASGAGVSSGGSMAAFFKEWSAVNGMPEGCKMCENAHCRRPETRAHEFRRCVVCERAAYCSRYCQVMDWKRIHYRVCKSAGMH